MKMFNFLQQIGNSGTEHTSRGTSRGQGQGQGQGQGSNKGQILPNFGNNQNKSLPSTGHHLSLTRGRGLLGGQLSWPRDKPITNKKQIPVTATIKVANNKKQGQKRKDSALV